MRVLLKEAKRDEITVANGLKRQRNEGKLTDS